MNDSINALRALLDRLDALSETLGDDAFDDLNAEFEDTLLLLSDSPDDPDALADAREELEALSRDYARWPEAREIAGELGEIGGGIRD